MAVLDPWVRFPIGVRTSRGWEEIGVVEIPVEIEKRDGTATVTVCGPRGTSRDVDLTPPAPQPETGSDLFSQGGLLRDPHADLAVSKVALRCADCGRVLRPYQDELLSSEHGIIHFHCPTERNPT